MSTERSRDDLAINTDQDAKKDAPHSAPFLSLLYNTASNLLSHVVELEPEKDEEKQQSPDKAQPVDITHKKEPENFLSFIYDLAGLSTSPVGSPETSPVVQTPPEAESKKLVLFDASELEEFDFPEVLHEDYTQQNVYIPTHQELHHHLPPILQEASNVTLLYSLENHGISIHTLYHNTAEKGPCLVVIKDTNGQLFGAFSSEELHIQPGYYGNVSFGRCREKTFKCTTRLERMITTHGKFGLWIDDELNNGHSEKCETFNNEMLSSSTEYNIATLEVWGFVI
ncbi:hypothetical protein HK103_003334 [Boothiomyces macroporosus]|uniref:Oxidation resistance protein 1 n=1 Tax=Boothiomyces macroporosus TaxID=261099 RepID=A0AAD5Y6F6_9FUNG|nr:hypothetical protein HK103_003334 [Boothiomyces macroporosus]